MEYQSGSSFLKIISQVLLGLKTYYHQFINLKMNLDNVNLI